MLICLFKFFDISVNKRNFLKNINLHFWLKIPFDSIDHDVLNFRLGYVRRLVKRLKYGFYKSYFFSEWTSDQLEHFLNIFVTTFGWVCCCFAVAPTQKWWQKCSEKCSTDQRFIRKRNTTYKIHTLDCRMSRREPAKELRKWPS